MGALSRDALLKVVNKLLRLLGTLLLCSDIAVVATLFVGVLLLMSGREHTLEQAVPLLLSFLLFCIAGRIVAGVHVLFVADLSPGDRLDAFMRNVFVTGLAASRYLRSFGKVDQGAGTSTGTWHPAFGTFGTPWHPWHRDHTLNLTLVSN